MVATLAMAAPSRRIAREGATGEAQGKMIRPLRMQGFVMPFPVGPMVVEESIVAMARRGYHRGAGA